MQISRLFEIVYILLERGTVTARELSERFEVSSRTIYRDVENLSAAGVPVYMEKGRNGGIRLLPDFVLDKTVLTPQEKEEILSALQGLAATGHAADWSIVGDESTGTAGSALQKLAALFGETKANWIEVDFSGWGWGRAGKEKLERLKTAVTCRRAISFTYYSTPAGRSGSGGKSFRVAEPLKLVFKGQAWYVYGWCRLRSDFRFFKLSRMRDVTVLDEVFDRAPPERVTDQELPAPSGEFVTIAFRADASVAFRIYDEFPHDCIRQNPDGSLLVRAEMPRGEWLVSYFLTYSAHIEILEPAFLRAEMTKTLGAALENYRIP